MLTMNKRRAFLAAASHLGMQRGMPSATSSTGAIAIRCCSHTTAAYPPLLHLQHSSSFYATSSNMDCPSSSVRSFRSHSSFPPSTPPPTSPSRHSASPSPEGVGCLPTPIRDCPSSSNFASCCSQGDPLASCHANGRTQSCSASLLRRSSFFVSSSSSSSSASSSFLSRSSPPSPLFSPTSHSLAASKLTPPRSASFLSTPHFSLQASHFAAAAKKAPAGDKAAGKKKGGDGGMNARNALLLKILSPSQDAIPAMDPEMVEEGQRLAKEYSRLKMRQHHAHMGDLAQKIKLREAAIAALPPHLRAAALEPCYESFPIYRRMPTWTPPIPGFAEANRLMSDAERAKKKRR